MEAVSMRLETIAADEGSPLLIRHLARNLMEKEYFPVGAFLKTTSSIDLELLVAVCGRALSSPEATLPVIYISMVIDLLSMGEGLPESDENSINWYKSRMQILQWYCKFELIMRGINEDWPRDACSIETIPLQINDFAQRRIGEKLGKSNA